MYAKKKKILKTRQNQINLKQRGSDKNVNHHVTPCGAN